MAPDEIHHYDEFIDGYARMMHSQRGVPLVGGRIFAYLLVCEPTEQTAAQISAAVTASLGTVSSMTRLLLSARLIERETRRGERSAVYLISPGAMSTITRATIEAARSAREMTDRGLALMADRPPTATTTAWPPSGAATFRSPRVDSSLARRFSSARLRSSPRSGARPCLARKR